jgi:hypothetical protein
MLCAWSSQYPHRPIPPDQSRSVYQSRSRLFAWGYPLGFVRTLRIESPHLDPMGVVDQPVEDAIGQVSHRSVVFHRRFQHKSID